MPKRHLKIIKVQMDILPSPSTVLGLRQETYGQISIKTFSVPALQILRLEIGNPQSKKDLITFLRDMVSMRHVKRRNRLQVTFIAYIFTFEINVLKIILKLLIFFEKLSFYNNTFQLVRLLKLQNQGVDRYQTPTSSLVQ